MSTTPEARLAEIQKPDESLKRLITKREAMIADASSWIISREDPDLDASAKTHASYIVNTIAPRSIARLERRRIVLAVERANLIHEHAGTFVARAEAFAVEENRQTEVVEKLKKDYERGFINGEAVERREAELKAFQEQKQTDPALQAGFELLAQRSEQEASKHPDQSPHQEAKVKEVPEILSQIKPYSRELPQQNKDRNNSVGILLRQAKTVEPDQRTPDQVQLIEDVEFLRTYARNISRQENLSPNELNRLVTAVRSYLQSDTLNSPGVVKLLIDAEKQQGRPRPGVQDDAKQDATPGVMKNMEDLAALALNVSKKARFSTRLEQSGCLVDLKDSIMLDGVDVRVIVRGIFDAVGRDLFFQLNPTPEDFNYGLVQANRKVINSWYENAEVWVDALPANPEVAILVAELKDMMGKVNLRLAATDMHTIASRLRLQLRIGHTVNDINRKLKQALAESVVAKTDRTITTADDLVDFPQIGRIASIHEHKYNAEITVAEKITRATETHIAQRTPEQVQLLEDVNRLKKFTDSTRYQNIYTPEELHSLVEKLDLLARKNRPDFDGVEDAILGVLDEQVRKDRIPDTKDLREAKKRANENQANRIGMQWHTLIKFASEASGAVVAGLGEAFSDRSRYLMTVKDPQPGIYPDLSPVFQFVAVDHVLDILSKRAFQVDEERAATFVQNCPLINVWFEQINSLLGNLPDDPQLKRLAVEITTMVNSMNNRLKGGQTSGYDKDYKINPGGAIALQLRIGHTVSELKKRLGGSDGQPTDVLDITPLE